MTISEFRNLAWREHHSSMANNIYVKTESGTIYPTAYLTKMLNYIVIHCIADLRGTIMNPLSPMDILENEALSDTKELCVEINEKYYSISEMEYDGEIGTTLIAFIVKPGAEILASYSEYDLTYTVHKHSYRFDDCGVEEEYEEYEDRKPIRVFGSSKAYSDSVVMYFAPECSQEEAERLQKTVEAKRTHMFSDYLIATKVPHGYMLEIISPYDD